MLGSRPSCHPGGSSEAAAAGGGASQGGAAAADKAGTAEIVAAGAGALAACAVAAVGFSHLRSPVPGLYLRCTARHLSARQRTSVCIQLP